MKYRRSKIRKRRKNKKEIILSKKIIFKKSVKLFILFLFSFINFYYLKNSINNINIAISLDNNFIYPGIVFLTSLLDNRANSSYYTIHLVTNNNTAKEDIIKLNTIVDRFGNNSAKLKYYILENDFKDVYICKHFSSANYFRISFPSILTNVNKIIYYDLDILNLHDLSELYNYKLNDKIYFAGVLDDFELTNELKPYGIYTNKYINSGVLIINLKAIRKNSIEKKLKDFISTHNLSYVDQTAINTVCVNNIQILPYKYNIFDFWSISGLIKINNDQDNIYKVNNSELIQAYNEPTSYHYRGIPKPWHRGYYRIGAQYWWYYAKMSGFYKEILDYFKLDNNYIESLLRKIPADGGLLKRNFKKFILL